VILSPITSTRLCLHNSCPRKLHFPPHLKPPPVAALFRLALDCGRASVVKHIFLLRRRTEFIFSLAHIHLSNGRSVRGTMIRHPCTAYMTIYVPANTTLRMACVILDPAKPHTHPMPPEAKLTLDVAQTYRKCVRAKGVLGATVQQVDDGTFIPNSI
jgi:hypothetical protein